MAVLVAISKSTLLILQIATLTGNSIFISVFGLGVGYFWPTILGFVAENIPKSGALFLNLMCGAGIFCGIGLHHKPLYLNLKGCLEK
nr:hypothetical protein [uncultured Pedobacter sp.]